MQSYTIEFIEHPTDNLFSMHIEPPTMQRMVQNFLIEKQRGPCCIGKKHVYWYPNATREFLIKELELEPSKT